jgi:hypothetical protein
MSSPSRWEHLTKLFPDMTKAQQIAHLKKEHKIEVDAGWAEVALKPAIVSAHTEAHVDEEIRAEAEGPTVAP